MFIVMSQIDRATSSLFIFTESGINIRTGGKIVEKLDKSSDSMMRPLCISQDWIPKLHAPEASRIALFFSFTIATIDT
jgi:hypothetical protein